MSNVYRTEASATVTVSTVRYAGGYETAIMIGCKVSDGRRTTRKADAGLEHDAAVAWVRGHTDPTSKRHAFWTAAYTDLVIGRTQFGKKVSS